MGPSSLAPGRCARGGLGISRCCVHMRRWLFFFLTGSQQPFTLHRVFRHLSVGKRLTASLYSAFSLSCCTTSVEGQHCAQIGPLVRSQRDEVLTRHWTADASCDDSDIARIRFARAGLEAKTVTNYKNYQKHCERRRHACQQKVRPIDVRWRQRSCQQARRDGYQQEVRPSGVRWRQHTCQQTSRTTTMTMTMAKGRLSAECQAKRRALAPTHLPTNDANDNEEE